MTRRYETSVGEVVSLRWRLMQDFFDCSGCKRRYPGSDEEAAQHARNCRRTRRKPRR